MEMLEEQLGIKLTWSWNNQNCDEGLELDSKIEKWSWCGKKIMYSEVINTPYLPNSRVQSPTGISWSWDLNSYSLNKKPSFPQASAPTYGSQNVSSNRVTGWDDEGVPMYVFEVYVISDIKIWRQSSKVERSKLPPSSDVNLWHNQWRRPQKRTLGYHHHVCDWTCVYWDKIETIYFTENVKSSLIYNSKHLS